MVRDELINDYYNWICGIVCETKAKQCNFSKLLSYLHSVQFDYIIGRDGNRAEYGMDLRYRFGYENKINQAAIADILDDRPCSVLEMMVALSLRCEENIMNDIDVGNRTGYWFWNMIKSLGLYFMTNEFFDEVEADNIVNSFLNRRYFPNGKGGLFTIPHIEKDLRNIEIWYQMMWYLDYILDK